MPQDYRILKTANIFGFLFTIVINGLANTLPLNGVTTGELSDMYPNLFTPASYVFSIWGIIYVLLAAFTYYQYTADDETHNKIGWLFFASCIFNGVWIFFWHYMYVALSVITIFGLLACLILIYRRLNIGLVEAEHKEKIMVHTTFSVYLGWITVAPIANVAALLVDQGWPPFNTTSIYITALMILVALVLTLANIYIRGDVAYTAVLVWAIGGIVVKQMNTPIVPYVAGFSIITIVATLLLKKKGRLQVG
ncbi:MAG: TspO/MBR family protein [archaeon]